MRITIINSTVKSINAHQSNLVSGIIRAYHVASNLRIKSAQWAYARPFLFPVTIRAYEKPLPSLPWMLLLLWLSKFLLSFFCCVFSFNFRNRHGLYAVEEYYKRWFVIVTVLLGFAQFWQITISWGILLSPIWFVNVNAMMPKANKW